MKIDEEIVLVLSGSMGFDITDPFDCNVFALKTKIGWVMFDCGAGCDLDKTFAAIDAAGITPAHIFLTHAHADHSGAAAALRDRYQCAVWAGAETARLVERGDEALIGLTHAREAGIYPADYQFSPCKIDHTILDNQQIEIGGMRITALKTPGHSADHMSYLVDLGIRRILVSGDALFHGGQVAIQDIHDCNIGDVCASVRRLAALPDVEVLLPGHLTFSLTDGGRHAQTGLSYVEKFQCPPSII